MKKMRKRRGERGSVIFESMVAICIMMMIFFALFQIYDWCMAMLFTQYSAFYGSKGAALGYKPNFALRGARVAAIPISGRIGRPAAYQELADAKAYMSNGDASGVAYPYWHPATSSSPWLEAVSTSLSQEQIECRITMRNMPLIGNTYSQQQLDSSSSGNWNFDFGKLFGITRNPEPSAKTWVYNFSKLFLEL